VFEGIKYEIYFSQIDLFSKVKTSMSSSDMY
jgi:hypothetical protein